MKAVIISIASLFLLSACVEDDDSTTVYDIECQGEDNGWHTTTSEITAADDSTYQFDGKWHCYNDVLWYSEAEDEVNLFGYFIVTKTDSANETSKFRYSFIQLDQAQNLIIQQDGTNDDNNQYVASFDATFKFTTSAGILPQVFTMEPYNTDSYSIEYNDISENIASLGKTIFKEVNDDLYLTGTTQCDGTNNQNWACENWNTTRYNDQTEEEVSYGDDTEKTASLTPDVSKLLNNPLETRDELIRLVDELFATE